jgi:hypothetical protein
VRPRPIAAVTDYRDSVGAAPKNNVVSPWNDYRPPGWGRLASKNAFHLSGSTNIYPPEPRPSASVSFFPSTNSSPRPQEQIMADETKEQKPGANPEQQQGVRVQVEDKHAVTSYANFCRVTGTPEELIIDFGLNAQPFGVPSEAVQITQRIVTNYFTAKRLLHALHLSVQRHEQAFGVLETDVNKRVVARPQQG